MLGFSVSGGRVHGQTRVNELGFFLLKNEQFALSSLPARSCTALLIVELVTHSDEA